MSLFLLLQSAAQAADQMPDLTQVAETTVPTEAQINIIDLAFKGGWIMVVLLLLSLLAIYILSSVFWLLNGPVRKMKTL